MKLNFKQAELLAEGIAHFAGGASAILSSTLEEGFAVGQGEPAFTGEPMTRESWREHYIRVCEFYLAKLKGGAA